MVDELPAGKPAQIGLTLTSQGWQAYSSLPPVTSAKLPWLAHVADTVLQLPNSQQTKATQHVS